MIPERLVTLAARDGVALEGRLAMPDAPRGGVVVCHPHPLYGGDLGNPVVARIVEACAGRGLATLRFNFRGVGASEGTHDGGGAERGDVLGALDHLRVLLGRDARVALAGYSFGAAVAGAAAPAATDLAALALIAPPLAVAGDKALAPLAEFAGPLLVVAGSDDDYCPPAALGALARTLPRAEIHTLAGADHFFTLHGAALGALIEVWAARVG